MGYSSQAPPEVCAKSSSDIVPAYVASVVEPEEEEALSMLRAATNERAAYTAGWYTLCFFDCMPAASTNTGKHVGASRCKSKNLNLSDLLSTAGSDAAGGCCTSLVGNQVSSVTDGQSEMAMVKLPDNHFSERDYNTATPSCSATNLHTEVHAESSDLGCNRATSLASNPPSYLSYLSCVRL